MENPKVSESLKGKYGPAARRWKGEKASYAAKHMWLTKHYDKNGRCEKCGTTEASRYEWANISGEYKRDRSDYMELCPACHKKMDYGNACCQGHEYTPENTYISKEGWRTCRMCVRASRIKTAS